MTYSFAFAVLMALISNLIFFVWILRRAVSIGYKAAILWWPSTIIDLCQFYGENCRAKHWSLWPVAFAWTSAGMAFGALIVQAFQNS